MIYYRLLRRHPFLSMVSILSVLFLVLALLICASPRLWIDIHLGQEFQEKRWYLQVLPISQLMNAASWIGDPWQAIVITITTASVFTVCKRRKEALLLVSVFGADVLTMLIKILIHRPRPTSDLLTVAEQLNDPSFPSAHVVHTVIFFGLLLFFSFFLKNVKEWQRLLLGGVCVAALVLIPLSRLYLGVHWSTDVLGGFLLGAAILILMIKSYLYKS